MSHGQVMEHVTNHVTVYMMDNVTNRQLNHLAREQGCIVILEGQVYKPNCQ